MHCGDYGGCSWKSSGALSMIGTGNWPSGGGDNNIVRDLYMRKSNQEI